jgi:hypothetical protein
MSATGHGVMADLAEKLALELVRKHRRLVAKDDVEAAKILGRGRTWLWEQCRRQPGDPLRINRTSGRQILFAELARYAQAALNAGLTL